MVPKTKSTRLANATTPKIKSTRIAKTNSVKNVASIHAPIIKKSTAPKSATKIAHPSFITMITDALVKLADRNGSSRQAIVKFIVNNYKLEEKFVNQHTKMVLKNGVKTGNLKQSKGIGASGSFKLGDKLKTKTKKSEKVKKAPVKPKQEASVVPPKNVVKVTITKTKKGVSSKKAGEVKPKRNLSKVVKVVATKPVTKVGAMSRIKQPTKKTSAQPTKVQVKKVTAVKPKSTNAVKKVTKKTATKKA